MQTKAAGATREDQHSLAPIQLERTSIERDLASIKRGQGAVLTMALLGSLVVMAGLLKWMDAGDGRSAYATAARQLDSLYAQPAEDCTLLQPYASRQVLRTSMEAASQHYGKAYEKQLAPCSAALAVLERKLGDLDVPLSMQHRLEGLQHHTAALNRAIGRYRSYLFDPKLNYDFAGATSHIENVVVAWSNYDAQRKNTFAALHAAAQRAQPK